MDVTAVGISAGVAGAFVAIAAGGGLFISGKTRRRRVAGAAVLAGTMLATISAVACWDRMKERCPATQDPRLEAVGEGAPSAGTSRRPRQPVRPAALLPIRSTSLGPLCIAGSLARRELREHLSELPRRETDRVHA